MRLHFKELHEERDRRPVYLIEHGLTAEDLDRATHDVRDALHGAEISSGEWAAKYMPLLVIAAEVGYEFGADGHEYWPVLEERLDWEFTHERRHALRDLFRDLRSYTGVEPADTEWAQNFHLIAWPIAHAVLPKRLHDRLLRAILQVTTPIVKGGDYFDQIREAAPDGPLAHFLAQEDLARGVLEGILGDEPTPLLSQAFIERLRADVLDAPVTRALARQVKARQDALKPARARATRSPAASSNASRVLPISLYVDPLAIEPRVPALRNPALQLLGAERSRMRVLGTGRHYTVSALDTDGCALPTLQAGDAPGGLRPLIADDDLPQSRQTAVHLKGLCVDLKRPLLFVEAAGGDLAYQVRGGTYPDGQRVWVLPPPGAAPPPRPDARRLVCGEWIYRCATQGSESWLASLGLNKAQVARTQLVGWPSLSQALASGGVMVRGDELFIDVDGSSLLAKVGADEVTLEDGVYALDTGVSPASEIALTADSGRAQVIHLELVDARPSRPPLVEVRLEGPPTVGALRAGRLSFRVLAEAPLAGLRLTVRARELGREAREVRVHTEPLPSLPAVISGSHGLWERLARELSGLRSVVLEAHVGGLGGERWTLDLEDRSFAWSDDEAGPALESEEACRFDAARPWEIAEGANEDELWLVQPLRARDGTSAPVLGSGVVGRGRRAHVIGSKAVTSAPKRLLRRLDSNDERGHVGALQIVTAWLCWATATALDPLAAGARREVAAALDDWTATALCGPLWAEIEADARRGLEVSFGRHAADALWCAGMCRDPEADELLNGSELLVVQADMAREISAIEGWLRRSVDEESMHDSLAEGLDELANEAYKRAALRSGRRELDPDVGSAPDEVVSAIRDAVVSFDETKTATALLSLLLPHSLGRPLAGMDYAAQSDGEIVDQLVMTLKSRPEGVPWPATSAEALLNVWVHPTRARIAALPDVLGSALEDRGAARMIRYCALRRRAALGVVP